MPNLVNHNAQVQLENKSDELSKSRSRSINSKSDIDDDSKDEEKDEDIVQRAENFLNRKQRKVFKCPHKNKKHYAKNMCINCYHRRGRTKKAWDCPHKDKLHYSKGLCQNCYLAKYYRNRKEKRSKK